MLSISPSTLIAFSAFLLTWLPFIYIVYICMKAVYNLTLHPLAHFPGPKAAAATRWYEVYWEVYLGGRFSQHIERLHQQYGPIIRVNPNELHIDDPEFYDQLYNFSPDIDRPWTALDNLQSSQAFKLHKVRRRALDPYFSRSAVLGLETVIDSNVEELCRHFYDARASGQPLNITLLSRCLTAEIISEYLFARPYGFLREPHRSEPFFSANDSVFRTFYIFRESRILNYIFKSLNAIPPSWLPNDHMANTFTPFINSVKERLQWAQKRSEKETSGEGHRILFEDYPSLDLPQQDFAVQRRLDTALMFVTAGFETTGYAIETAIYHVLANPSIHSHLQDELTSACPDPQNMPTWSELEKLPYLTAVITESLRMSIGVMSRLPRKNMKDDLMYKNWVIPKRTLVSLSQKDIHFHEDIYPEPTKFEPQRWLKGEESKQLHKYFVAFSRGARRCIGMHLAYAELYIALATIFRRFNLQLHETERRDVDAVLDFFIPKPEEGGNGVRVLILP